MIVHVQGEVISTGSDSLVLQMGGFGLKVNVPAILAKQYQPGENVFLYSHLIVREDNWSIYGFVRETDRDFFVLLLGVSGVGPRSALLTISTLSVDVIRRAVLSEQSDVFARVPGVGKKTGQKIVLHLQGKVGEVSETGEPIRWLDVDNEVLDALTSLGYSIVEAQRALQSIPHGSPEDLETRLRLALQFFSR
jgi:Holliday junction DNA helicase RuvA